MLFRYQATGVVKVKIFIMSHIAKLMSSINNYNIIEIYKQGKLYLRFFPGWVLGIPCFPILETIYYSSNCYYWNPRLKLTCWKKGRYYLRIAAKRGRLWKGTAHGAIALIEGNASSTRNAEQLKDHGTIPLFLVKYKPIDRRKLWFHLTGVLLSLRKHCSLYQEF